VHVRRRLVGNGVAPACAHLGSGGRGGEVELGNGAAEVARGGLDGGEGAELDVEALDGVADLGRPLATAAATRRGTGSASASSGAWSPRR
jgi:hypothetical protein